MVKIFCTVFIKLYTGKIIPCHVFIELCTGKIIPRYVFIELCAGKVIPCQVFIRISNGKNITCTFLIKMYFSNLINHVSINSMGTIHVNYKKTLSGYFSSALIDCFIILLKYLNGTL
jgi:hypothetical protein